GCRGASAGSGDQPDDEPDDGHQQHQQDPQHLAADAGAGAEDIDDGPDVERKNNKPEDTADLEIHDESPVSNNAALKQPKGLRAGRLAGPHGSTLASLV